MSIKVIEQCPHCHKTTEYKGKFLEAVETLTKQAWLCECPFCRHLFLSSIGDKKVEL